VVTKLVGVATHDPIVDPKASNDFSMGGVGYYYDPDTANNLARA
jgi:hypothetical protein